MKIIIAILFLFHSICSYSQSVKKDSTFNKFDKYGKKTGFWIDSTTGFRTEHYFRNGKKDGIEKVFYKNGLLGFFGTFKNNHTTGVGYFFDDKGRISFTVLYEGFVIYQGQKYQKGYFTLYEKSGQIKKSYNAIFKEGEEEMGNEIRIWKKELHLQGIRE